jgi:thiol-disulfide isomerase/thioredoxin
MTDSKKADPARPTAIWRTGLVVGVAALASVAVLYGFGMGGKETANAECAASRETAARIAPLAHGEVAALAVEKSPRMATDIAFTAPDGAPTSLAAFRGKTILLNLWATWCIPCREEMPSLDRLQSRAGSANFEVVAVNIDTTRLDRRKAFLSDVGVKSLGFYSDPSADVFQKLKKAGKVLGLPTTILIDAKGCELGIMPGPADWASDDAIKLTTAIDSKG